MAGRPTIAIAFSVAGLLVLAGAGAVAQDGDKQPTEFWQGLREEGRRVVEELKERARPRHEPAGTPLPDGRSGAMAEDDDVLPAGTTDRWSPPDVAAPTFSRIVIEPRGMTEIQGRGTPGSRVELSSDGDEVGTAVVSETGEWQATLGAPLSPGVHRIETQVRDRRREQVVVGHDVRISIPDGLPGKVVVPYNGNGEAAVRDPARNLAEALANDASEEFSQLVPKPDKDSKQAPAVGRESTPKSEQGSGVLWWLERSAKEYQTTVIKGLSEPSSGSAGPGEAPLPASEPGGPGLADRIADEALRVQERVGDWLAKSNRDYQEEVARRLSVPPDARERDVAGREPEPAKPEAPVVRREDDDAWRVPSAPETRQGDEPRVDDRDRRRQEEQAEEARRLAEARQKEEQSRREQSRRAETQRKEAEDRRLKEEAARREAETRRAAEETRLAEEKRRKDDARRAAEARRLEEQAREAAELKRRQEEMALREAEDRRKAEEAKREVDAKRLATEAGRKEAEELRRAEAARQADEKRLQEEANRREAEEKRLAESERKAEEKRLREVAKHKSAEDRRAADVEKKAEAKRVAEEATAKEAERKRLAAEARSETEQKRADADRTRREEEKQRREAERAEQEAEAAQLAADVERRRQDAGRVAEVTEPQVTEPAKPKRTKSGRKPRDPRPVEGSAEDADVEPVGKKKAPQVERASVKSCGTSGVQHVKGRRMYVVQPEDSLWSIAKRFYGSGKRYNLIYQANKGRIRNPNVIRDCQRIHLPSGKRSEGADDADLAEFEVEAEQL